MACYKTTRRVEFRDTDAAGVAHFSAFFIYMEEVEHEYLRHLGLSVLTRDEVGPVSWPRVAARCEYHTSVRFEEELEVELDVVRVGEKSLTYEFSFSQKGKPVAVGQVTSVCCRLTGEGPLQSMPIPDWILQKLPKPPKK